MERSDFLTSILDTSPAEVESARRSPTLVAVSGGADSVALLCALLELGCRCHAAHCNFRLRGEESNRDERFVRDMCARLGVPLKIKEFDVAAYQAAHGGSVEMACRDLRYAWFEELRQQQGYCTIAVAHHADDQVETFFLNLLRGTGTRGLAGMKRVSGYIWRPLLSITRNEILSFLSLIGQEYVTDSTNAANDYRRNMVRNLILPEVQRHFSHANDRIIDTMRHLMDDITMMEEVTSALLPNARHIDIAALTPFSHAPTLLYHRVRHLGFNRLQCEQAINAALGGHSGRQFEGKSHTMIINRQSIDIEAHEAIQDIEISIELNSSVESPIRIVVSSNNAPFSPLMCDGKDKVAFSKQLLECKRIVLRHWRKGDRIKPFGMNGSRLVSDLFNDLKLNHRDKHQTWIMEADGEIIWVIGHRATRLFPVEKESQDYLLLHYHGKQLHTSG